jgi:hypothetical protein
VGNDQAPQYDQESPALVSRMGEQNDIFQGREIGPPFIFVACMAVVMIFQVIGFFACTILSLTHAGRLGARAGLGMVLIQFALTFNGPSNDDATLANVFAFVFMMAGWFIMMQSITEYVRLRRIYNLTAPTEASSSPAQ